jgi:hypothetical protein
MDSWRELVFLSTGRRAFPVNRQFSRASFISRPIWNAAVGCFSPSLSMLWLVQRDMTLHVLKTLLREYIVLYHKYFLGFSW